jgi:hypothetical protein
MTETHPQYSVAAANVNRSAPASDKRAVATMPARLAIMFPLGLTADPAWTTIAIGAVGVIVASTEGLVRASTEVLGVRAPYSEPVQGARRLAVALALATGVVVVATGAVLAMSPTASDALRQWVHSGQSVPEELQTVLREVLRDPSLRVGYRLSGGNDIVDANGAILPSAVDDSVPVRVGDVEIGVLRWADGARAARQVRADFPELGIVLLSQHVESRHSVELVASGRFGYLLKDRVLDVDDFLDALRRVATGGSALDPEVVARLIGRRSPGDPMASLTPRERDVPALMAEGRNNVGIAGACV